MLVARQMGGTITLTWHAPMVNIDGTPLVYPPDVDDPKADMDRYRLFYRRSNDATYRETTPSGISYVDDTNNGPEGSIDKCTFTTARRDGWPRGGMLGGITKLAMAPRIWCWPLARDFSRPG